MSLLVDPSSSPIPQLALLPNVQPLLERNSRISVWRLPAEISQSRLCGRTAPSNACTLIALQLIELIERRNLHFVTPTQTRAPLTALPIRAPRAHAGAESRPIATASARYLVGTFVEAMVEGNEAHERATKNRSTAELNFTIPDAITALNRRHTEIDFCSVTGSFTLQLPRFIRIALRSPCLLPLDRLHFVVIAFERTVLLVADRRTNSFILMDSHLHGSNSSPNTPAGGIIAAAHFSDLTTLVQWMADDIFPETHFVNYVQEFEISTVSYAGSTRDCMDTRVSGFSSFRPAPPIPRMRPTPIFTTPQCDKENRPPGIMINSHVYPPPISQQGPPKKMVKRSADSQEPSPLGSSNYKRVRTAGPDTTATTTVSRHLAEPM